jgi:hypothetical protein
VIFKAALRSREAFLMSKALLVVVSGGGVWWCLVVSWHFSSPVIGRSNNHYIG